MNRFGPTRLFLAGATAAAISVLSACAPKPPPPPPAPPPIVRIPPRPEPPLGAPVNLTIPPLGPDGTRLTVNSNLSTAQATWNLRSALNVAALNCLAPEHAPILTAYGALLKDHAKTLKTVNSDLDKNFRAQHGPKFIPVRETYQTQVYNYFALPPVMPAFCREALNLSAELGTLPVGQLEAFAPGGLAKLDYVFREFFNSYDQYRSDLATWESRYGAGPPLTIMPSYTAGQTPVVVPTVPEGSSQ